MEEREPEFVDGRLYLLDHEWLQRMRHHYRQRPLRWHFGAWLIVGLTLGFLIAPNTQPLSLLAFMFSGCVCCTLLALLTYPVSDNYRLTLIGAGVGFLLFPMCAGIIALEQSNINAGQLGLVMGALTGASSLVWLGPIRYLRRVMQPAFKSTAVQPEQSARF